MDLLEHDAEFVMRNLLDGIKETECFQYDTEVAGVFNVSKEQLNQWKVHKRIPYEMAMLWAKNNNVSLSWLLLRQGEKDLNSVGVSEPRGVYQAAKAWDLPLFNKCLNIMNEEATRRGMTLDADNLLKAVAVLYQTVQNNDQEPDMQLVEGLLELAG